MTRKYVEQGACFIYDRMKFMLEPDSENAISGKIYIFNGEPKLLGTYVWGLDPKLYVTVEVLPGHPCTIDIWKRKCQYAGKYESHVQV